MDKKLQKMVTMATPDNTKFIKPERIKVVNCRHDWGTDGQHQNIYCKKCFISKDDYNPVKISTETEYIFVCPACGITNYTGYAMPAFNLRLTCGNCDFHIYDFCF